MKGIILAGGLGRRLYPMTKIINKHLLPIYDSPMVFYPIKALREAGIYEIILVTGDQIAQFKQLLGDGKDLGVHISYCYQEGEAGIADALSKTETLIGKEKMIVILGDNIFEDSLSPFTSGFSDGAQMFLKKIAKKQTNRFGIVDWENKRIIEKPDKAPSQDAVVGIYMFDSKVFTLIKSISPSARGELEVTDLLNKYWKKNKLTYCHLEGFWVDSGIPEAMLLASNYVAKKSA